MRPILFSAAGFDVFAAPVFSALAGLAAVFCFWSFRRRMGLSQDDSWGLVSVMSLGAISGALLLYAVLYNGGIFHNLTALLATKRNQGGSFWGAFWGAFACIYAYCRAKRISFRGIADIFGLSAMLGLAVMRLGCLQHGCCHGIPTTGWWEIVFTAPSCAVGGALLGEKLYPTQIFESLGSFLIFLSILVRLKAGRHKPGAAFLMGIVSYSALRFSVDFVRGGGPGILDTAYLKTSQLIAIVSASGSLLWSRRL